MASPYGSMPWSPRAAILLTAQTMSCCRPQMELVVPKRMSGLTGSSDRREAAPLALVGPTTPAAAVKPLHAMADERNSRLLSPRSVTFVDIRHFLAGKLFDVRSETETGFPFASRSFYSVPNGSQGVWHTEGGDGTKSTFPHPGLRAV